VFTSISKRVRRALSSAHGGSPKTILALLASLLAVAAVAPSAQAATNPFEGIFTGLAGSAFPPGMGEQLKQNVLAPAPKSQTGTCQTAFPSGVFPKLCVAVLPQPAKCKAGSIRVLGFPQLCTVLPPKAQCNPAALPNGGFSEPCAIAPPKSSTCKSRISVALVMRCEQVDLSGETTNLSISGKSSARRIRVGKKVTYSLTVTNVSLVTATDVTIDDQLDGPGTVRLATTSKGQCDSGESDVQCDIDELGPGASFTVKVRVKGAAKGRIINSASAEALDPEDSEDTNDDLLFKTRVLKRH
jgi:uncharacterized repeat protein (TIGR01451 family)